MKTFALSITAAAFAIGLAMGGSTSASAGKLKAAPKDPSKKITVFHPNGVVKKICTGTGQKYCAGN